MRPPEDDGILDLTSEGIARPPAPPVKRASAAFGFTGGSPVQRINDMPAGPTLAQQETVIRRVAANKAAEQDAQRRAESSAREADFRSRGVKHYTDAFGNLQPVKDEQGREVFTESQLDPAKDEKTGAWYEQRRTSTGEIQRTPAPLRPSADENDPNLYYDLGNDRREKAGHADDILARVDERAVAANPALAEWRKAALKAKEDREKAVRKAALAPLEESQRAIEEKVAASSLRASDLATQAEALTRQLAEIDANPQAKARSGGVLGIGASPTPEAERLQRQRADLQAKLDAIQGERTTIEADLKEGPTAQAKARAKTELDLAKAQSEGVDIDGAIERRRAFLKSAGKPEGGDTYLRTLTAEAEKRGHFASETKRRVREQQKREQEMEAAAIESGKAFARDAQVEHKVHGRDLVANPVTEDERKALADTYDALKADRDKLDTSDSKALAAFNERVEEANKLRDQLNSTVALKAAVVEAMKPKLARAHLVDRNARRLVELMDEDEKMAATEKAQKATPGQWGAAMGIMKHEPQADEFLGRFTREEDREAVRLAAEAIRADRTAEKADWTNGNGYRVSAYDQSFRLNPASQVPEFMRAAEAERQGGAKALPPPSAKEALEGAVAEGIITREQADQELARVTANQRQIEAYAIARTVTNRDFMRHWEATGAKEEAQPLQRDAEGNVIPTQSIQQAALAWLADPKNGSAVNDFVQRSYDAMISTLPIYTVAAVAGRVTGAEGLENWANDTLAFIEGRGDVRRDENFASSLASGVGSVVGFAAGGQAFNAASRATAARSIVALRAAGAPKLAQQAAQYIKFAPTIVAAGSQGSASMMRQLDEAGVPREDQWLAIVTNGGVMAATETLPYLRTIDTYLDSLSGKVRGEFGKRLTQYLVAAPKEAAQEGTQTLAENLISMGANPDVDGEIANLFEGLGEATLVGGIVGAGAAGGFSAHREVAAAIRGLRNAYRTHQFEAQSRERLASVQIAREGMAPSVDAITSGDFAGVARRWNYNHAQEHGDLEITPEQAKAAAELLTGGPDAEMQRAREAVPAGKVSAADALMPQAMAADAEARFLASYSAALYVQPELDAIPDDAPVVDPATGQPMPQTQAERTRTRDAATALSRIALGVQPEALTATQATALASLEQELGVPAITPINGVPVVTDAARQWLGERSPTAASLLRPESEMRAEQASNNQSQGRMEEGQAAQTEPAPATPAPANVSTPADTAEAPNAAPDNRGTETPTPAGAENFTREATPGASSAPSIGSGVEGGGSPAPASNATVSYTDEQGNRRTRPIPAGATTSDGKPVRNVTTARQWIAENAKGRVSDVQFTPAPKASAPTPAATSSPANDALQNQKEARQGQEEGQVSPAASTLPPAAASTPEAQPEGVSPSPAPTPTAEPDALPSQSAEDARAWVNEQFAAGYTRLRKLKGRYVLQNRAAGKAVAVPSKEALEIARSESSISKPRMALKEKPPEVAKLPAPIIARGENAPARFVTEVFRAAQLAGNKDARQALIELARRLGKANPEAFAQMEVRAYSEEEWRRDPGTSAYTPDSSLAYNPETNTLYLRSERINGDLPTLASGIVHESGHFAERFAADSKTIADAWAALSDAEIVAAAKDYNPEDARSAAEIRADNRSRSEWFAQQFARVVTGRAASVPESIRLKLASFFRAMKAWAVKYLGTDAARSDALDREILRVMGFDQEAKPVVPEAQAPVNIGPKAVEVGKNADGQTIYQNPDNGRRYIIDTLSDGSRYQRSETMRMVRYGEWASAPREGTPFETAEEAQSRVAAEQPTSAPVAPAARPPRNLTITPGTNPNEYQVREGDTLLAFFKVKDGEVGRIRYAYPDQRKDDIADAVSAFRPTQPTAAPAPSKVDALADKLFDGLLGTPSERIKQRGFPRDRRQTAIDLAEAMIESGIRTPEGMAEYLDGKFAKKARPFSQSLWSMFAFAEPSLASVPDWDAVYAQLDGAGAQEAQPEQADPTIEQPAPTEAEANAQGEEQAMRALIISDYDRATKARMMKKIADRRGIPLKQVQEETEAVLVKMMHEQAAGRTEREMFDYAREVYEKQPLFSARTSTSVENQAYSTPAPLAVALMHMTNARLRTMYEPTAGTGMLMIGSGITQSQANELNDVRADALRSLGVAEVTQNDATRYVPDRKFARVHANPPFGTIDNVNYDGFGIRKLEHLISLKALEAMENDGTAALILGASMKQGETSRGAQWVFENYLYSRYNVVGNFEVDGDLYANQGAKWPVRVIAIAGRRASPLTGELAPKTVDRLTSWDSVWQRASDIRNEIDRINNPVGTDGQAGPAPVAQTGRARPEVGADAAPASGENAPRASVRGKRRGNRGGEQSPARPAAGGVQAESAPVAAERPEDAQPPVEQPDPAGQQHGGVEGEPAGRAETAADAATRGGEAARAGVARELPRPVDVGERQFTYVPRSEGTPFGTLTPRSIGIGAHAALDALVARVGPLSEFVGNRLNMSASELQQVMSADQIDGVALAIDQIESGGALIIGDETGIGKGRQAAALIRYAKMQDKIPVFFTLDPKLFTDMNGDLRDINTTIKPLIFGEPGKASIVGPDGEVIVRAPDAKGQKIAMKRVLEEGMEAAGYDSIFVTYSQINMRNERQLFLERLANESGGMVVILDEAHSAAGDGDTSMQAAFMQGGTIKRGKGSEKTTVSVPGLLRSSALQGGRGGVLYLSATYAKRPDNMPLYFRTAMSKATQDFRDLVDAMKSGGVALQQAVSEALAASGQYLRRERDFSGINFNSTTVEVSDRAALVRQMDDVTSTLQDIVQFSKAARAAILESGEGLKGTAMTETQINVTDFASVVHNQISQLLLSAKADEVVNQALAAKARGEKPVITLMNTMESFLSDYVSDLGVKPGQEFSLSWRDLLRNALARTLRVTTKLPNGDTEISAVSPGSIGMAAAYRRVNDAINDIEVSFPVSPIDYIVQRLGEAGMKIGELTGRESGITYTDYAAGRGTYRRFKKANKNALVNGFNSGALDALLLNASGSTGLSIHAAPKFKDTRKRHMIIAQPALDINVVVQTLGRIKRTGMLPGSAEYTHLKLPLQAELRPAAVLNRKMKSLNANTTAESEGSVSIQSVDMLNKYGDQVVSQYLAADIELQSLLNMDVSEDEDGQVRVQEDAAKQFMGRLALLPDAEQARIYGDVVPAYTQLIEQLKSTGEYDLDMVIFDDWDGVLTSDMQLTQGTDESSIFTASVRAQKWEITDNRPVPTGDQMVREFEKNHGSKERFYAEWSAFTQAAREAFSARITKAEAELNKARDSAEEGKEAVVLTKQTALNRARIDMERWERTRSALDRLFVSVGEPVQLAHQADGKEDDTVDGMLVGVVMPDLKRGLRVAPSRFQLRYMVNRPGGRFYLSGAQFTSGEYTQVRSSMKLADFAGERGGSRYERYVVTGNPIAAYKATGGKGKMVRFKARDGAVVTGLLMKPSWDIKDLAQDPRTQFNSGAAVQRFLLSQPTYGNSISVEGDAGVVRIGLNYRRMFEISVPSSVKGRDYFLDPELREIVGGDFFKAGNRMVGQLNRNTDSISRAAERVAQISGGPMKAVGSGQNIIDSVKRANTPPAALGTPSEPTEASRLFTDLLQELPDRARDMVRSRIGGETFESIGARYGFDARRAESLFRSALGLTRARLRKRMGGRAVDTLGTPAEGRGMATGDGAAQQSSGSPQSGPLKGMRMLTKSIKTPHGSRYYHFDWDGDLWSARIADHANRAQDQSLSSLAKQSAGFQSTSGMHRGHDLNIVTKSPAKNEQEALSIIANTIRHLPPNARFRESISGRTWGNDTIEVTYLPEEIRYAFYDQAEERRVETKKQSAPSQGEDARQSITRGQSETASAASAEPQPDASPNPARTAQGAQTLGTPSEPTPSDDAAIREHLEALRTESGLDAAKLEADYQKAISEQVGQRTVGDPRLANPGRSDATRAVTSSVDEQRRNEMERESHDLWQAEAERQIAANFPAVVRDLLERVRGGLDIAANPVAVKAAQIAVERLSREAVTSGDAQKLRDAQTLAYAYRVQGSEQARALAARRDPFRTPQQRMAEFFAGILFTPPVADRKAIAKAWTPREKARRIEELTQQLEGTRRLLAQRERVLAEKEAQAQQPAAPAPAPSPVSPTPSPTPAPSSAANDANVRRLKARIAEIEGELDRARRRLDREEKLHEINAKRLQKINRVLSKMGVTVADLFAGDVVMRLKGERIVQNVANERDWDDTKKRLAKLAAQGWDKASILKKLRLSEADARRVYEDIRRDVAARLAALGTAALDAGNLESVVGPNDAGTLGTPSEPDMGDEIDPEKAKKIEDMLAAMGLVGWEELDSPVRKARVQDAERKRAEARKERAKKPREPKPEPAAPGETVTPAPDKNAWADDPDALPPAIDPTNPADATRVVREAQTADSGAWDMAHEYWINSILSGPLTQAANITGNTLNVAWTLGLRRALEATVNDLFIRRADLPHLREYGHMLRAVIPAIRRAWGNAVFAFSTEQSYFARDILETPLALANDGFDDRDNRAPSISGTKGRIIRIPVRLLGAVDDFTKTITASMEAAAHAYRIAKTEGMDGDAMEKRMAGLINTPGSAAWIAAYEAAQRMAFQEEHGGDTVVGKIELAARVARRTPGVRYLVPFVKTPLNIFTQGIRQSPFGTLALLARYAGAMREKQRSGTAISETFPVDDQLGRIVEQFIAYSIAAMLYGAAAGDDDDEEKALLITGALPETTTGLRALAQRAAITPYTLRVGDYQIRYNRIEPLATILGVTVDMLTAAKRARNEDRSPVLGALAAITTSITAQAENKTMLAGVEALMEAVKQTRQQQDIGAGAKEWAASFLSSWIPNILRQPVRMADPVVRQRNATSFPEMVAENVVPQLNEPMVDVLGREVEKGGNALARLTIPAEMRARPELERVDRLLLNWNQTREDPEERWAPSPIPGRIKIEGRWRPMTDEERSRYGTRAGQLAANMLRSAALNTERPTQDDIDRIKRAFTTARQIARREVFGGTSREE